MKEKKVSHKEYLKALVRALDKAERVNMGRNNHCEGGRFVMIPDEWIEEVSTSLLKIAERIKE